MLDANDMDLVREYASRNSEQAFETLVHRHINLVHSVALRHVRNPAHAEEVTQAVFIILARKAASLRPGTVLGGWLYETARLSSGSFLRGEHRRQRREQEAHMQSMVHESANDSAWEQLAPHLDEAMAALGEKDRNAVVLRFFQNKNAREIADSLGVEESAAQKRVSRAVEKLRSFFTKRGVTLSATAVCGAIAANSVQAAPAGLATAVCATAIKGSAVAASTLTLVEGTMKIMTWMKLKFALVAGVATLLVGGVATVALSGKSSDGMAAVIPTGGHAGVTFFSLLEKKPIVADAVFEKELFLQGVPADARKQTFSFKCDGDNYLLNVQGIQAGRFGEVMWLTQGGNLTEYDPRINNSGGDNGGVVGTESVTRMTVNLFLTLGITEIKPGSAIWDESRQRFTGMTDDGRKVTVDVKLENGVPSVATILTGDGQASASIRYKYAPTFYKGQVPVEFTRYWGNFTEDDKKVFTVRVQSLEIADHHLDKALINPPKALKDSRCFYSNNVAYWVDPKGKISRVLTMEEYKLEMEKLKAKATQR